MKTTVLFLILITLVSCSPYTEIYPIQGKWYQDRTDTLKRDILYFTEDGWLLTGIDHGVYTEVTDRQMIQYWNGMIYLEGCFHFYKIYGKYLQIFDNEYIRLVE
ncbi:MAG: hypothetical protein PQJ58_11775 [Spirochaetales bacterium]|nr:hypothetical protein [Spirochaetales bacterium]